MRSQPTDGTVIAGDLFCASLRLKSCMQKSKTRLSKSSPPRCVPPAVAFALRMSSYAVKRGTPGVACNFSLFHRKASQSLLSLAWKMKGGSTQRAQTAIPADGWRATAGAFFVSTFVLEVHDHGTKILVVKMRVPTAVCTFLAKPERYGCGSWLLDDAEHTGPTDPFRNREISGRCDAGVIRLAVQISF